jgi:hypothetical protein
MPQLLRGLIIAATTFLAAPAIADPGAIQDPTGCISGNTAANCRSMPPLGSGSGSSSGDRLRPGDSRGLSSGDRLRKSSPLPSQQIQRSPPPILPAPGSTGLGGGSTGLGH